MQTPQAQKSDNALSVNFAAVGDLVVVNVEINASKTLGTKEITLLKSVGLRELTKMVELQKNQTKFEKLKIKDLRTSAKVIELEI